MHGKPGEKRENWLLIKGDDEFARAADEADILEERPESINTGRTIDELEGEAPGWSSKTGKIEKPESAGRRRQSQSASQPTGGAVDRSAIKGAEKAPLPGFIEPMLATLAKSRPPAIDGCMRSSSTAIDCRRISRTARSRSGPAAGSTGRRNSAKPVPEALRNLPVRTAVIDGETGGRERERRRRVLASASRSQRWTASTASSSTPSIASISTGTICAKRALIRRKELLEKLIGTERRRRSLQLPFRGGRQACSAARLRARARRRRFEGQPVRSMSRAAARAGSRPNAQPSRNS